ncbi:Stk1 family PASTA domain-containing Ser/Thr kinase [Phosphitispora sp. TUW77]|uniref:Stk1 family PASTA domain-containing Ser/Thr kinase n=1 Tax=Phosphitispora sp. TUW77 TaxID=3152361 RepID=UPI003AB46D45
MIGNLLGNRYEIVSRLGGGGMAVVYKARDTLLNRQVTVKVLRSEFTSDEEFVSRFRREAQAVAKLSHPNIVSIYDVGQDGEIHYIVMEYIEGRNLKEIIKEHGKLPVDQAVDIARQICEGLNDAHENGIVHRDVKPHNILVTDNGRVKVTDFGIAQIVSSVTITNSSTIVGSVHYFSPEQAKGETTGVKSDIYSVGVVLYEMLTGKVPFEGETPIAIALKHIKSDPVPPRSLNPAVLPDLERIILKAMHKDTTMRYLNAGDMARDLRRISSGDVSAETRVMDADEFATRVMNGPVVITGDKKEDESKSFRRKRKRKLRPAVIILVVALLGLLTGIGYIWINDYINVPEVTVPDVENIPWEEAEQELNASNLKPATSLEFDSEVESGYIISQDPPSGTKVKENTIVKLVVSKGAKYITVPNVARKEKTAAEIEVTNAGFKVSFSDEFDDEVEEGTVIAQTPAGDTEAKQGSTVKLVISKGPEPEPVQVPDIVGISLSDARAKLDEAELTLDPDSSQEESREYISGYVVRQEPAPGTEVQKGDKVKIVLSTGPGPEEKTARVDVIMPADGLTHQLKIVVLDVAGERVAYGPAEHNSGEPVSKLVTYYERGAIRVFVDDFQVPYEERPVN